MFKKIYIEITNSCNLNCDFCIFSYTWRTFETIDSRAFYYCTKLANVEIEEGLKTINSQAFYGVALVEISLPSTIETIGSGVFSYASDLTSININKAYDGNLAKTAPWGASSSITINWKQ